MKINPGIFKAYDIRGIYPQDINEENFPIIIQAIYQFFKRRINKEKVELVLGYDMRISSPSLHKIAQDTLLNLGVNLLDIGMVSTPTFYFAVLDLKADCGIQISASHNPPEWNGVKFVIRDGNKIIKIGKNTGMEEVKNNALNNSFLKKKIKLNGSFKQITNIVKKETDFAFKIFNINEKKIKPIKVVADPANAMGIAFLEELFRRLPCQLIKINFNYDGNFPAHEPNPLIFENLKELQKKVVDEKADLGIAPDGDGDRVFFINEKGEVIWASLISCLIAERLLRLFPKEKIGVDIRYILNIKNTVEKNGGEIIIGPVGHALISNLMINHNILFTGESSGHFFYRHYGYAESSIATIIFVLEAISSINKPISQILKKYQVAYESGEKNFKISPNIEPQLLFKELAKEFEGNKISRLDGLSVELKNLRFNLRASNTEPLIRLNVEGFDKKEVIDFSEKIIEKINNFSKKY